MRCEDQSCSSVLSGECRAPKSQRTGDARMTDAWWKIVGQHSCLHAFTHSSCRREVQCGEAAPVVHWFTDYSSPLEVLVTSSASSASLDYLVLLSTAEQCDGGLLDEHSWTAGLVPSFESEFSMAEGVCLFRFWVLYYTSSQFV